MRIFSPLHSCRCHCACVSWNLLGLKVDRACVLLAQPSPALMVSRPRRAAHLIAATYDASAPHEHLYTHWCSLPRFCDDRPPRPRPTGFAPEHALLASHRRQSAAVAVPRLCFRRSLSSVGSFVTAVFVTAEGGGCPKMARSLAACPPDARRCGSDCCGRSRRTSDCISSSSSSISSSSPLVAAEVVTAEGASCQGGPWQLTACCALSSCASTRARVVHSGVYVCSSATSSSAPPPLVTAQFVTAEGVTNKDCSGQQQATGSGQRVQLVHVVSRWCCLHQAVDLLVVQRAPARHSRSRTSRRRLVATTSSSFVRDRRRDAIFRHVAHVLAFSRHPRLRRPKIKLQPTPTSAPRAPPTFTDTHSVPTIPPFTPVVEHHVVE